MATFADFIEHLRDAGVAAQLGKPLPAELGDMLLDAADLIEEYAEYIDSPVNDDRPPCAVSMGCLCAGHARGNPSAMACDTTEAA